jgi:hypothetical protein
MPHASLFVTAIAVCATVLTASAQGKTQFRARLSTVPIDVAMQNVIAGSGAASATLTGNTLTVSGEFNGLKSPATFAKIHVAPKGIRGPAILDLDVTKDSSGTLRGTFELDGQQIAALKESRFYVQIHSEKAPEGNLWGWLLPQAAKR